MGLTLFSETACEGTAKELKESKANLVKSGVDFPVRSARVDGNPWILFREENFVGFLVLLEEGVHEDLSVLGLPPDYSVRSVEHKKSSLAFPLIRLFNSSLLKSGGAASQWWVDGQGDEAARKLQWLDIGLAGLWAIDNQQTVLYKTNTGHSHSWINKSGGLSPGWCEILGKMRTVSVGMAAVWAVNPTNEVFVRVMLSDVNPKGKEWTKIDGSMKMVSVGPTGECWGVDNKDVVYRRHGARNSSVIGTKWQVVPGKLSFISVGQGGVWGLTPQNQVLYREGTYDLPGEGEGTDWTGVDGMMVWLACGEGVVWAASAGGQVWYRAGMCPAVPTGSHWAMLETGHRETVRQVLGYGGALWALDGQGALCCREQGAREDLADGNSISLMEDQANFKSFTIQEKPSSFKVVHGAWALYEKANFKGKSLYCYPDDCYSNDPEDKQTDHLSSWQESFGSLRPIHGVDCRTITASIAMDWAAATTEYSSQVLATLETRNEGTDFSPATWQRVNPVEARVTHRLTLSSSVPGLSGSTVTLEGVPKQGFNFRSDDTRIETGSAFRQELAGQFSFLTDSGARRERRRKEVVILSPNSAPKTEVKVSIVVHQGTVKIPFLATFSSGNSTWVVPGSYIGEDATHIKTEMSEVTLHDEQSDQTGQLVLTPSRPPLHKIRILSFCNPK